MFLFDGRDTLLFSLSVDDGSVEELLFKSSNTIYTIEMEAM